MFKTVRVKNFRAITDLTVDGLGRVNLFVGHNACGKTTLLESIFFLVGPANPHLPVKVNVNRGLPYISNLVWPTYFHNMDLDASIEIIGEESESDRMRRLLIRPRYDDRGSSGGNAASSMLPGFATTGPQTHGGVNGLCLEYDRMVESEAPTVSEVVLRGDEMVVLGAKDSSLRSAFLIPVPGDLHEAFSEVQKKKRVPEIVSLLKELEPELTDLRLSGSPNVLYADIGAPELIPTNLMGGGIMRFLSAALAMLVCQDGVVLIDEIENGLHHSAQGRLWGAVFSWARKLNVQVFATTHSMECIKAFSDATESELFGTDAKLLRIERKGDAFRSVEYERDMLAESLESNWEIR